MRTGNVIRDPNGNLWIVTEVRDDRENPVVDAVAFDAENVSATQRLDDYVRDEACGCEAYDHRGIYAGNDPYCEDCGGRGKVTKHIAGWKRSKVLAPSVKDFILRGMKKSFNME